MRTCGSSPGMSGSRCSTDVTWSSSTSSRARARRATTPTAWRAPSAEHLSLTHRRGEPCRPRRRHRGARVADSAGTRFARGANRPDVIRARSGRGRIDAMRLFLDTAEIEEIREINRWGVLGGVTTNPTLVAKTRSEADAVWRQILSEVAGDVSLETTESDADAMYKQ